MKIGNPSSPETKIGAVVSKVHLEKILSYIALAKEEGGEDIMWGKYNGGQGVGLWKPTVIEGLSHDCRVNQEEIFGAGSEYDAL